MDFTTKELLKRYAKLAIGQPFAPILLNILVTSVCDLRGGTGGGNLRSRR